METDTARSSLLSERILNKIFACVSRNRVPLSAAMLFGLLAHGFAFTNKFINHDEIRNLFGKGATVDSGRWALGALDSILPNYSMPWIYGILTVFLIAVSACLIIRLFEIRNPFLQILLAGTLEVSPVWASTFSFMFTSSAYGIAFLLAVLSVCFLRRKHPFFWAVALGCGIFSVAIYQAYIAIIASLLVLLLIRDLLEGEDLLPMFRRGLFYVGFLILTLGFYYLAAQAILILKDVEFNQYAAERDSFDIAGLPRNIGLAYSHFFNAFTTGEHALIPTAFSRLLHRLSFAACAILLVVLCAARKMKPSRILFVAAMVLVFPLAVNCMYLFTLEAAIHTLVLCGFQAIYVALIMFADLCISVVSERKLLDVFRGLAIDFVILALSVVVFCHTYFANEAYLELHLQYENTYAFYTSLLSDIRMQPEFDEDTQLAVIGQWRYPDYFFKKFEFTYDLFGHLNATPGEYSMDRFLEYYIGFQIPFAPEWMAEQIQASEEFMQMPVYPYYGSIQMFEDVLVVKLS